MSQVLGVTPFYRFGKQGLDWPRKTFFLKIHESHRDLHDIGGGTVQLHAVSLYHSPPGLSSTMLSYAYSFVKLSKLVSAEEDDSFQ